MTSALRTHARPEDDRYLRSDGSNLTAYLARLERAETEAEGRWRAYDYDELIERDKCSLDLFWLKDDSLLDAENLPDPDVIVEEIAEDLRGALEQIEEILGELEGGA